ncbi:MAG TPA: ROK family protein [Solirubrobacteraceae bacterium]
MHDRLIGVDVGGTKVSVATLIDGRLSEPLLRPTDTSSTDALIDQLVGAIREAAGDEGAAAVGLGVPSVVDWATGTIRSSVNIPLADVPLREVLRERLDGMPVYVDNDATVAALAEAHADDGTPDVSSLVMFTCGTGVGGGIVIDGRVFHGATGAAAELGHMIIGAEVRDGRPAHRERFPQPGSLEALAAGRALDVIAQDAGYDDGIHAVDAAHQGEQAAIDAIALIGHRLGLGIANMINALDPEVVAIGGGVSAAGELLLDPAKETAALFVVPGVGTSTEIRIARSGPRAGVRGAALLAGQELTREQEVAHR